MVSGLYHEKYVRRKLSIYELTCNLLVNLWIHYFRFILDIWQGSEYASGVPSQELL